MHKNFLIHCIRVSHNMLHSLLGNTNTQFHIFKVKNSCATLKGTTLTTTHHINELLDTRITPL